MGRPLVAPGGDWDAIRARFRWPRPERFNLARACCGDWAAAEPDRPALIFLRLDGERRVWTHGELWRASGRLANALAARGLGRGDRCGLLLPQTPEALLTHLACWRLGAVTAPLFTLFGEDGLRFRLGDSGAKACVTDAANLPKLLAIRDDLPALETLWSTDRPSDGAWGFWQELAKAKDEAGCAETLAEDPAFLSYTSGTTGPPKGALHAHRVLIGHMPGFETHHDFAPQPGDLMWTPADWAWLGGLMDALLPSLFLGMPVLAHRAPKFDPEAAWDLLAREGVRNAFMPPTALKMLRQHEGRVKPALRSVGSGGEALGGSLLEWGIGALGVTINEFYGQTECNLVLGNSSTVFPPRPGSTGRAVPGFEVAVIDPEGAALPDGAVGEIAVEAPNPSLFLEYRGRPEKTAERFVTGPDGRRWLRTGDEGRREEDGAFFFSSRSDDVITSSGYRIGPSEIEDCLSRDPAVGLAAVVGLPDAVRGEAVTAFCVLSPGFEGDREALAEALKGRVRERVGAHSAPRRVAFVGDLPLTATGKIMRREVKRRALEGG
ncbi:MAG: AMP-binding protein [Paracoccaceae bacterium]